jgi:hypothetical protein
MALGIAACA